MCFTFTLSALPTRLQLQPTNTNKIHSLRVLLKYCHGNCKKVFLVKTLRIIFLNPRTTIYFVILPRSHPAAPIAAPASPTGQNTEEFRPGRPFSPLHLPFSYSFFPLIVVIKGLEIAFIISRTKVTIFLAG